jgi:tetratricopeptide (TPR) repeat protein
MRGRGEMVKIGLGLLAAIVMVGAAAPAEAKWLRADTNNFIIYSEGTERDLRDFAEKLERFDATLRYRFKVEGGKDPNPLTIFLVDRAVDAGRLASGKSGSSIAGFYSPGPEGSFAVSNREDYVIKGTPQSQQTLFHEYSHHFMKRFLPGAFPAWFIEGFAEYYSSANFTKDGRAEIGKPVYSRAYGLLTMPKIPASILLFQRPLEMRNSGQMDVYYGRAWLLTHMLFNDEARVDQLGAYVTAINKGIDPKQAATDSFGDLATLDKDLNRYLNKPMSYRTTADAIAIAGPITIGALTPAQDAVVPLRLERLSADSNERLIKARDGLKRLTAQYPGDAGIWYEFAMAEWGLNDDSRDKAAARTAVDKALAIDPKHVRANVLLGQMLTTEVEEKADATAADWNAVRKPIVLANRTNSDDPVPLYSYYKSFIDQRMRPPPIAIEGLSRAFHLGPENIEVRMNYAFALANSGKFDAAINLAKIVAFDPHDGGAGEQLLERLEAMRKNAAAKPGDENADAETTAD